MNLKNCSTAIFVNDIKISKEFYCNLLGLIIDLDFGKNVVFKAGFAIWEIQNNHIIPLSIGLGAVTNSISHRFELYFETENLPDIYKVLTKNNVRFLHEIHEETWGQQTIRFFDPDNHLIEIGESIEQFVCRFYNLGMSIEEVSKKTSIPVYEVERLINK